MGDVVTALGRAIKEEGHKVQVVIPKFDCINFNQVEGLHRDGSFSYGGTTVHVWKGIVEELQTVFLEPDNGFFGVGCIYGKNNDNARYELGFAYAVLMHYIYVLYYIYKYLCNIPVQYIKC